jgi:hypothetical protein
MGRRILWKETGRIMEGARRSLALAIFVAGTTLAGTWACGSSTGLDDSGGNDNGQPGDDSGPDASSDSPTPPIDAPTDTILVDVNPPPFDVVPPPFDVIPPPFDVVPPPFDVVPPPFDVVPPPFDVVPPFDVIPPPFDVVPPFDVGPPPPPWDGGNPIVIATGEEPVNLALDNNYVYWENGNGSAVDCPLAGCPSNTPTILTLSDTGNDGYQTLASALGSAFFIDGSYGISSCAGGGCDNSPSVFVAGEEGDSGVSTFFFEYLVVDSSNVYMTDGTSIYQCPFGGLCDSPLTIATSSGASLGPLGSTSGEVYFADDGTFTSAIRAVPIGGGSQRRVCTSTLLQSVVAMVVTPAYVYFTTYDDPSSIYQCASGGGTEPSVYASDDNPYSLATDGTNLYWTNDIPGGNVVTCPLGATCESPHSVATNQNYPNAIAVNATSVYWTTNSNVYMAGK